MCGRTSRSSVSEYVVLHCEALHARVCSIYGVNTMRWGANRVFPRCERPIRVKYIPQYRDESSGDQIHGGMTEITESSFVSATPECLHLPATPQDSVPRFNGRTTHHGVQARWTRQARLVQAPRHLHSPQPPSLRRRE